MSRRAVFSWWFGAGFCDPEPGAGGGAGAGVATPPAGTAGAAPQAPAGITQAQLQTALQPLATEMRQQLQTALAPIQQQQQALQQQVEAMRAPLQQASQLFGGGAPFIRQGESVLSSRGYQYWRAMGIRTGQVTAQNAKYEMEVHAQLHEAYHRNGFIGEAQSILVPLGTTCLMEESLKPEFLAELRQSIAAGCDGFDLHRAAYLRQRGLALQFAGAASGYRQAMSQFDDTGLGTFLGPTQRAGELIELIRNREAFSQLGATQLTLPPNGRLQFDRQTGATTAYWVGEVPSNASTPLITSSAPTTGFLTLLAKKLAVLCKLPNELLRFATPELETFLRADMVKVMGLEADLAMLEAVGSTNKIRGIINYAIQSHTASTVATDGNTLQPKDLTLMMALLEDANHDPETGNFGWLMRPRMWANICERRADAVTADDQKGPYLFPVNRADITAGRPSRLQGHAVARSNQVSKTRTKGSATDLTYVLAGLFEHWMIARVGVMEFATTTSGDTPFQTDQTWVRAIQHLDAGPRYEDAFVVCDSIDMDLGLGS